MQNHRSGSLTHLDFRYLVVYYLKKKKKKKEKKNLNYQNACYCHKRTWLCATQFLLLDFNTLQPTRRTALLVLLCKICPVRWYANRYMLYAKGLWTEWNGRWGSLNSTSKLLMVMMGFIITLGYVAVDVGSGEYLAIWTRVSPLVHSLVPRNFYTALLWFPPSSVFVHF